MDRTRSTISGFRWRSGEWTKAHVSFTSRDQCAYVQSALFSPFVLMPNDLALVLKARAVAIVHACAMPFEIMHYHRISLADLGTLDCAALFSLSSLCFPRSHTINAPIMAIRAAGQCS